MSRHQQGFSWILFSNNLGDFEEYPIPNLREWIFLPFSSLQKWGRSFNWESTRSTESNQSFRRGAGSWALWTTWGLRSVSTRGALDAEVEEVGLVLPNRNLGLEGSLNFLWLPRCSSTSSLLLLLFQVSGITLSLQRHLRPVSHDKWWSDISYLPMGVMAGAARRDMQIPQMCGVLKPDTSSQLHSGFVHFLSIRGLPRLTLPLPFSGDQGDSGDLRQENISRYRLRLKDLRVILEARHTLRHWVNVNLSTVLMEMSMFPRVALMEMLALGSPVRFRSRRKMAVWMVRFGRQIT